ncbi:MAG: hypothetical protein K5899_09325 [Bacteroidaceae bacterium]|nr:hypothetical protein [Bacteroidaceae bacterium]
MDTKGKEFTEGFNGFSPEEMVCLYKFLCAYEKIESYRKDDSFKHDYPAFAITLFSTLDKLALKPDNCITMIQGDLTIKYTPAHRTKYMAFLYHFRNAIAHGRFHKKNQVEIHDFDKSILTAYGFIDSKIANDIITMIITEFLN